MKVSSDDAHAACSSITDETRTYTHALAMLPALLIRYTTVNILTQPYLELQLALAETTQTAHKSP